MNKIFLGYMGSGKTSLAKYVAKLTHFNMIDLDDFIIKNENKSIEEIFKSKGEIYFRKIEHLYLKEILNNNSDTIISVGGGTPCYDNNIDIINSKSISFYLKANVTTLKNRLLEEKHKRPLIAQLKDSELSEFIAKHLFERNHYYEKATHIVTIDNKNIEEIAKEIMEYLL